MASSAEPNNFHKEFNLPSFTDNIFLVWGYGSILWKQNFDYDAEYDTYIKGYKRVFYQGSKDHRGTVEKPGRVVMLLPVEDKETRVYGRAYQLPTDPERLRAIFNALDTREQGGYERFFVTLYDSHPKTPGTEHVLNLQERGVDTQGKGIVCLCYNGTTENKDYLGPDSMEAMAQQILDCTGLSGTNREYLFFLADSLRAMNVDDPHVFELEGTAKRLLAEEEKNMFPRLSRPRYIPRRTLRPFYDHHLQNAAFSMSGAHRVTAFSAELKIHGSQKVNHIAAAHYHEHFGLPSFADTTFVIFGYGSILWKQEFEYEAEYESYIKGYKRVFYQGTQVHRGQPGAPGRVVTLLPDEDKEARVYGKAYQLPADPEKLNAIFTALDVRESGYTRVQPLLYNAHPTTGNLTTPSTSAPSVKAFKSEAADVYGRANSTDFAAGEVEEELDIFSHPNAPAVQPHKKVMYLVYIATEENNDFMGDAPMEVMAKEILSRSGISGPNREYLFCLADCLRAIGAFDPHVFELDATAKRLLRGHENEYASGAKRVVSIA